MSTIIYHNPSCSKSTEALQLLNDHHEPVEVIEYLKTPPTEVQLAALITQLGIKAEALVRKHEPVFEQYAGQEFSDEAYISLMVKHPELIERPIIVKDQKAIIGRPPVLVLNLL